MRRERRVRSNAEKLAVFRDCFTGLMHVYGTYDTRTGRAYQVKRPVTDETLLSHLTGRRPYPLRQLLGPELRFQAQPVHSGRAYDASQELASERWSIPNWTDSIWDLKREHTMRNASCTTTEASRNDRRGMERIQQEDKQTPTRISSLACTKPLTPELGMGPAPYCQVWTAAAH